MNIRNEEIDSKNLKAIGQKTNVNQIVINVKKTP